MKYENVIDPILEHVERHPDRMALAYEADEVALTYAQMDEQVRQYAHVLRERGIVAGDKVAYLIPNKPEIVFVYLAIQRIGAVAVPLNFRLVPREIAFLTNAAHAKMLIFDRQFEGAVCEARHDFVPSLELLELGTGTIAPNLMQLAAAAQPDEAPVYRNRDAISRIQFTGGSTGLPKGVMRTHAQDIAEIESMMPTSRIGSFGEERVLVQCPLEHHGGHSMLMQVFYFGGMLVISGKFNEAAILRQIERYQVTRMMLLPPTMYPRLLAHPDAATRNLRSVRLVHSAAGLLSQGAIAQIYASFPNTGIIYGWGQSESGAGTGLLITREMFEQGVPQLESVGTPTPGMRVRIVDGNGDDVRQGEIGEAIVDGPMVMSGYYNQPKLTAEAFTPDGWLRTGDLMRQDAEGYFYMESRKKEMIKSGGENVFIAEVQKTILRIPGVADCVVFGTPDPMMGEAVAAVVQPQPGCDLTADYVQGCCKRFISSYKKPRYIVFTDDLGRDDAGKIRLDKVADYFKVEIAKSCGAGVGLNPR